jgi:ribosome-associated protein
LPSDDLPIRDDLVIPGEELVEQTSTSGGPGGQHANKTSTRVTLRWSVAESAVLDPRQRSRLLEKLASRLTTSGELVVHVHDSRSQSANRQTARRRLGELVREALHRPRPRKRTRPSRAARERRLADKKRRGATKKQRGRVEDE